MEAKSDEKKPWYDPKSSPRHEATGRTIAARLAAIVMATTILALTFASTLWAEIPTGCNYRQWTQIPVGGATTSGTGPAAVAFNDNLHLFFARPDNRIYTAVFRPGAGWLENYVSLSQNFKAGTGTSPAAVVHGTQLHLFAIDPSGRIVENILQPGSLTSFGGWKEVPGGGRATHAPGAVVFNDELNLFVRGTDGQVHVNIFDGARWSGWSVVPGGLTTRGPAAVNFNDTSLNLYVRGTDGRLYDNRRVNAWRGWQKIGTDVIIASPAATFFGPADGAVPIVEMLTTGLGGGIFWRASDDDGTFDPSEGLFELTGITTMAAPSAVNYNQLLVFVAGPGNRISCNTF